MGCMNTMASSEELSFQVEQLVKKHLEAIRMQALETVEMAFTAVCGGIVELREVPEKTSCKQPEGPRKTRRRRSPEEVAALGERLYEATCAQPGEKMAVLAEIVGASARELHRPMMLLKRNDRVRSVIPAGVWFRTPPISGGERLHKNCSPW